MSFDNQGIVSGTFLRQRWVLLVIYKAIYFTETYYKMRCITTRYTTHPQKFSNYPKINCFAAKTNKKTIHLFLLQNYDFIITTNLWGLEVSLYPFVHTFHSSLLTLFFFHTSLLTFFFFLPENSSHVKTNREQYNVKGTFMYYVITKYRKFGPPPLICTYSVLVAPFAVSNVQNLNSTHHHHHHHQH